MATTEAAAEGSRIGGRGFGPGLPAEGAPVSARVTPSHLWLEDWPGLSGIARPRIGAREQGDGLLLEWETTAGVCGLLLEKSGSGKTVMEAWLPPVAPARHDRATRKWLWLALFVLLGLPLLVLALFFGFRAPIVDAAVARIPVEQEQRLAGHLWQLQRAQLKLIENTAANRFIEETGARLVAAQASPYTYRFHLVDDKAVNAFAMPAGYIVVNRGLLEKAASAEEVAGVLAHEIEHVEQRHSLRGMVQALGLSAVWMALTGDLAAGAAGHWLKELAGLHFSREQEALADRGGYARLVAARIDPQGMASFFEKLAATQAGQPGLPEMLSTHPASEERAARLRELLKDAPAFPPLGVDWPALRASLPQ